MPSRRCIDYPAPGCVGLIPATERRCQPCSARRHRARAERDPYQSPRWATLSAECIARDGCCQVCGSTEHLIAHHTISAHEIGVIVPLTYLLTLCGSCHSRYEADVRAGRDSELRRLVEALGAVLRATTKGQLG